LGMTLADIGTLCVGDQKKLKEKMDIIGNNYGEKVRNVLEEMIEKDPKKRKDFLTLESSINFEEISMENLKGKFIFLEREEEEKSLVTLKKKT